jgi:hypothetical protein
MEIGPGKVRLHSVYVGINWVVIVSTGEFQKLAGAELAWNFAHHSSCAPPIAEQRTKYLRNAPPDTGRVRP